MKKKSKKSSNPIHLIIDGADKTGKSTVCDLLSEKLNIPIIKMQDMPKFFKKNPEEASEIFNKTVAQFNESSYILDRGFPSSIVYSKYFKRKYDLSYLYDIVKQIDPIVIILISDPRESDDLVSEDEQIELIKLYRKSAIEFGWYIIDATELSPIQTAEKILKLI